LSVYDYYGVMTIARLGRQGESPGSRPKRSTPMESSHAAALQSKHEGLERRIREEMSRPAPDETILQTLKKQKLRIKEALHEL
jgi:hypothetical protein